jgi:glycosyltransferase involved in cell wall biosynthesis
MRRDVNSQSTTRRRILVSAYAFSPVLGSEPGVGWNICTRLAKYHDITVLTRSWDDDLWENDEEIRREAEAFVKRHGPVPGLTIHFVKSPPLARLTQWRALVSLRAPFYFIGYAAWQRAAYREAIRLHNERPFDIAHQLTITTFREAGYLWRIDVPFIWGPIGGGDNIPWNYFSLFGFQDRLYYALKNAANTIHAFSKARSRMAAQRAACVLVSTHRLRHIVSDRWGGQSSFLLPTGAHRLEANVRRYDAARPLRILWSGVHIGLKAVPIALYALAELKARGFETKIHLKILGSGPATDSWRGLEEQLQLRDMVTWTGEISLRAVLDELAQGDLCIMPSLQEGTPTAVMEALASGLPVLCHEVGGLSGAIDESCGIKIPLRDAQSSIQGFANAIAKVVNTPGLLERLSAGALARAQKLSWDAKVEELAQVYDTILAQTHKISRCGRLR